MDKFLLAQNPMTGGKSGQFVIHMLDPVMIITCQTGHLELYGRTYRQYQFADKGSTIYLWTLSVHHSQDGTNLERENAILDRAWRWFRSYLESQL
jgi:hypothetical protein